jgi:hypothetical protein
LQGYSRINRVYHQNRLNTCAVAQSGYITVIITLLAYPTFLYYFPLLRIALRFFRFSIVPTFNPQLSSFLSNYPILYGD